MNKNLTKAVAAAVLAMGASAANAGITIPAGDWTIDIGGNVNTFYVNSQCDGARVKTAAAAAATLVAVGGKTGIGAGVSCGSFNAPAGADNDADNQNIRTGLLPSALGIGGKTRQNDLDIAFQFTFFVGADDGNGTGGALGGNSLNIRQAYGTFGDKSWGTIKYGRDLGIYGSDAILSDMTLLGVGASLTSTGGSSSIGHIGTGYVYADWVGQISYASPNWNGFSFKLGLRDPWGTTNLGTSSSAPHQQDNVGFEGQASYEWGGDVSGKVWAGFIHQKVDNITSAIAPDGFTDDTAQGWEIGGKVSFAGFGLVGYYYDGHGMGTTSFNMDGFDANGNDRDSDGFFVQATYALPTIGTKIGVSYGESNLDETSTDKASNGGIGLNLVDSNEQWTVGVYHPLTKNLNLVAEYANVESDSHMVGVGKAEEDTFSLGAIMFF